MNVHDLQVRPHMRLRDALRRRKLIVAWRDINDGADLQVFVLEDATLKVRWEANAASTPEVMALEGLAVADLLDPACAQRLGIDPDRLADLHDLLAVTPADEEAGDWPVFTTVRNDHNETQGWPHYE